MYTIPIENSVITCHKDPDGDALSACKAVSEYLRAKGKKTALRLHGNIPEHLEWIVASELLTKTTPPWSKQAIVLDSGPEEIRIGWKIPSRLCVINIDHHAGRQSDVENNVFVSARGSTCASLLLDFDVNFPILIVGLYTDTLFIKKWGELNECFSKLEITDEEAETFLTNIRPINQIRIINAVRSAKIHRTRNGFIIAETNEEDTGVLEEVATILHRCCESLCLISSSGFTKLRTSNPNLDVSKIAAIFGGGGHSFASCLDVQNGKATALKTLIKALDITHNTIEVEKHIYVR
jgi:nanoRNase/pAp phosphatase (c-di-AMP/oligoRNAs hydrolase)